MGYYVGFWYLCVGGDCGGVCVVVGDVVGGVFCVGVWCCWVVYCVVGVGV